MRVAIQAFAAACGGAQSIHTNGYDEALALPTEESAELALRTQQVLLHETGLDEAADPLGGSHYIEALTATLVDEARELLAELDDAGGAVAAIEAGWMQARIEESAYAWQQEVESGERVIVGVNRYRSGEDVEPVLHRLDPTLEQDQVERLRQGRASRSQQEVDAALAAVAAAADDAGSNLLDPMRIALAGGASIGEVCGALRERWGTFD